jgi:hypothetical protein
MFWHGYFVLPEVAAAAITPEAEAVAVGTSTAV